MWKQTLASIALVGTLALQPALAQDDAHKEQWLGMGTGAVVGAVVGGPAGFLIGLVGGEVVGAEVGEQRQARAEHALAQAELHELRSALAESRTQQEAIILERDRLAGELARSAELRQTRAIETELAMDVLFRTGSDELEPSMQNHVSTLAQTLKTLPQAYVRLEGHADRRGSEDANLALSERRAQAVKQALVAAGVAPEQVQIVPLGESRARAELADVEGLALDRKVSVQFGVQSERLQASTLKM